jgi:hypothetical protein
MAIVPVRVNERGIERGQGDSLFLPTTTFADLKLVERHLEDFIVANPDILFPDGDETFHIIATHVHNALGDEADVIGLLATGELVVVEVKRDKADMRARKEPLEWQAFRYAATLATLEKPEDIMSLFARHIAQHSAQYGNPDNPAATAKILMEEYLSDLGPEESFNHRQRVILVASDFDEHTLAACSWLLRNQVPLKCVRVAPHILGDKELVLNVETLLPLPTIEDYLPEIRLAVERPSGVRIPGERALGLQLLIEAGLLHVGDELYVPKAVDRVAKIVNASTVEFEGRRITPSRWGKEVTGWPTFSAALSAWLKRTGQKVVQLRKNLRPDSVAAPGAQSPQPS